MEDIAGVIAPVATIVAAVLTAANLSSRITGYGFVCFTIGSICWTIIGVSSGQSNLIIANGVLTLINLVGIWRWLGREARFADAGRAAARRSARAPVPSLFSAGSMLGSPVTGADGKRIGTVIDAMLRCNGRDIAYLVLSEGGVGGVGAVRRALDPALVDFRPKGVHVPLSKPELAALYALEPDNWPAELPGQALPDRAAR